MIGLQRVTAKQHAGKAWREMSRFRQLSHEGSNYLKLTCLISCISVCEPALSQDLKLRYISYLEEIPWLRLKETAFFPPEIDNSGLLLLHWGRVGTGQSMKILSQPFHDFLDCFFNGFELFTMENKFISFISKTST